MMSGHPPYEPGNQAALTHGAHSESVIAALAAEYADRAIIASPVLALERFSFSLAAWSHAEARAELIRRHLDEHGILNNRGTPRSSLLVMLAASERAAGRGREELGLSPASAARISMLVRAAGVDVLSPDERHLMLTMEAR